MFFRKGYIVSRELSLFQQSKYSYKQAQLTLINATHSIYLGFVIQCTYAGQLCDCYWLPLALQIDIYLYFYSDTGIESGLFLQWMLDVKPYVCRSEILIITCIDHQWMNPCFHRCFMTSHVDCRLFCCWN